MKITYNPKQNATNISCFSPSPRKPALVVAAWKKLGIPLEFIPFNPCLPAEIALVHNSRMVNDILSGKRANGHGDRNPEIAASLPWVCGSMVAAAQIAYKQNTVCFSPTSGAHHAGHDRTGGFCTFNFLALAARILYLDHDIRVGILDCDAHYGDGTEDIKNYFGWNFLTHVSMGNRHGKHNKYLRALKTQIKQLEKCDLIIYNAGADSHINDPLGGMLTTHELGLRDQIVFSFCKQHNIPVAVSLAGGYQHPISKVIEIHNNTLIAAHDIYS